MTRDEAIAVLEGLSKSDGVVFVATDLFDNDLIKFGGECQIIELSESGFWVLSERGLKRFFWRLDIDGLTFEDVSPSSLPEDERKVVPPSAMHASGMLIRAPGDRSIFLIKHS